MAEIVGILSSPIEIYPEKSLCESFSLQKGCYELSFLSIEGDFFQINLRDFDRQEYAKYFGIRLDSGLRDNYQAIQVILPSNYDENRWLRKTYINGMNVYHGGASKKGISIHVFWGRSSRLITEQEAIQVFSRLFDEQIKSIEANY